MAVLDRSWYGRVLVERVEGFASEEAWQRAYAEIVDLETTLAAEGTILVKFWMHVSPEEQLRRFEKRRGRPVQDLEAHRRGLAQPREAGGVRGRRRGHAGSAPTTRPGRGTSSPRTTSAGPASTSSARSAEAMEAGLAERGIDPDPPLVKG